MFLHYPSILPFQVSSNTLDGRVKLGLRDVLILSISFSLDKRIYLKTKLALMNNKMFLCKKDYLMFLIRRL